MHVVSHIASPGLQDTDDAHFTAEPLRVAYECLSVLTEARLLTPLFPRASLKASCTLPIGVGLVAHENSSCLPGRPAAGKTQVGL
jgi:hypothetical protein